MTRWQRGDQAPDATLRSLTGDVVTLSTVWHERGLVLAFLRHFG